MNTLSLSLIENKKTFKKRLPSQDILTYDFTTSDKVNACLIFADGMVNKELLGSLVARPLSALELKNAGGRVETKEKTVQINTRFPELKTEENIEKLCDEILDGNTLLLVDGIGVGFIVGAKLVPVRTISEPPTGIAVKGPREGFIEDIKTNMALVRKRLKSPELILETARIGKRSNTAVTFCYLQGIADKALLETLKKKLQRVEIDNIPDSSYIATLLSPRPQSVFRSVGTTEKPDVFTAKLSEGRIGILVDGSPIALTLPYILSEDLQTAEDYFISPFVASIFRFMRFFALLAAILLPAFYVSAQLFKMQLLPLSLFLTIASSVRELPLSPSLEMFAVLFLLETLKEASVRMPKYVGMSLSVVGALVLGETAVRAGFLSTPAIIIVALSGICLYVVPDFVETGSLLRWLYLIVAGCLGTFGIVLLSAFLLYYLLTTDPFGTPLLAPFAPLFTRDLRDAILKLDLTALSTRPAFLRLKNTRRLRKKTKNNENDENEK